MIFCKNKKISMTLFFFCSFLSVFFLVSFHFYSAWPVNFNNMAYLLISPEVDVRLNI